MRRKREAKPNGKSLSPDPMLLNRRPRPGVSHSRFGAAMLVDGLTPHAVVAREWARSPCDPRENMDLTFTLDRIEEKARRVSAGDLSHAEAVLTAQTVTLNAIFANLACRAAETTNVALPERYLRQAFRAQSQCRATFETLARLKSPPAFTRQADIAAQQVVNNGTMVTAANARTSENAQNLLSEAHAERPNGRNAGAAVSRGTALATVGAFDRAKDRQG